MAKRSDAVEQQQQAQDVERHANLSQRGIIAEFALFLVHNKKWWLTPIIVVLLLVGLLLVLGGSGRHRSSTRYSDPFPDVAACYLE